MGHTTPVIIESLLYYLSYMFGLPLIRWQMWNMPYHAEHHVHLAVQWHTLPLLHAHLTPVLVSSNGYLNFHQRVIRGFCQPTLSEAVA